MSDHQTVTGTLTASGATSAVFYLRPDEVVAVTATFTGTGKVSLSQVLGQPAQAYRPLIAWTTSQSATAWRNTTNQDLYLVLRADRLDAGASVAYTLADVEGDQILAEWYTADGTLAFRITDQGPVGGQAGGTLDVRAFGAVGDGVTDDRAAFVAAVAAAGLINGTVYVPPAASYYKLGGQLALTKAITLVLDGAHLVFTAGSGGRALDIQSSGVRVIGMGFDSVTGQGAVVQNNTNDATISTIMISQATTLFGVEVRGLGIRVGTGLAAGDGVHISNGQRCVLSDLYVDGHQSTGTAGIRITGRTEGGSYFNHVQRCRVGGNYIGIELAGFGAGKTTAHNWVENCVSTDPTAGACVLVGAYCVNNVLRDVDCEGTSGDATGMIQLRGVSSYHTVIDSCHLEGAWVKRPIWIETHDNTVLTNTVMDSSLNYGVRIEADGCFVDGCCFTGNTDGSVQIAAGADGTKILQVVGTATLTVTDAGTNTHQYTRAGILTPLKTDVVATASLPAAATAQDGRILVEDAGAGDRNLVIYAGGQRFRLDGGTAF